MRILLLTFTSLLFTIALSAQRPGGKRGGKKVDNITIKGTLLDVETEQALEFATISVYALKDSSLIGGGVTNVDGKFSVDSPSPNVYLALDFIGYQTTTITDIPIPNEAKYSGMMIREAPSQKVATQ